MGLYDKSRLRQFADTHGYAVGSAIRRGAIGSKQIAESILHSKKKKGKRSVRFRIEGMNPTRIPTHYLASARAKQQNAALKFQIQRRQLIERLQKMRGVNRK